jgi:hypothetical protein
MVGYCISLAEDWPKADDGIYDRKQAEQANECARQAVISRREEAPVMTFHLPL